MKAIRVGCFALSVACLSIAPGRSGGVFAQSSADDAMLADLEERTFDWFWEATNPDNGLAPDRGPPPSACSVAALGFALTAYPIGVERGYISRDQATARVLTTLQFLFDAPQGAGTTNVTGYHGFFYHFLELETGARVSNTELSSVDTAWLMMGVLFCQSYFDDPGADETEIRTLADAIYRRVEWSWMVARPPVLCTGWQPSSGYLPYDYRGYSEAMGLYLLALGSPTHPIDAEAWTAWTATYDWADFHGQEHVNFGPLFGHQFSHAWIDFRDIQDAYMRTRGIDYFENSRRAAYAQRAYAIDNPGGWSGFSENIWGLTACDGPANVTVSVNGTSREFRTYNARGAADNYLVDDGTIAPTAAASSLPFAPEIALPAIRAMRENYGGAIYDAYGFVDAFNPTFTFTSVSLEQGRIEPGVGWVDTQHLGIDQGPILLMLENYRSGFVWAVMQRNPYIVAGLRRAGFSGGWLDGPPSIREQPANAAADPGGTIALGVAPSGLSPFSYQWFKDGVPIDGATAARLSVSDATLDDAGAYRVRVSNENGSIDSAVANVVIHATPARLVNLSTRGYVGTGNNALIAGCATGGAQPQTVLIRAVGPTLAQFSIDPGSLLADPVVSLRDAGGNAVGYNNNWGAQPDAMAVQAAFTLTGAFPLPEGSLDAALLYDAPANHRFTSVVGGAAGGTGVAIVEIYALHDATDAGLVNLSTRGFVGTGDAVLIMGLYLGDGGSRRLLIRGIGPTLNSVAPGLQPLLADPLLIVRRAKDGSEVARNNNWGDSTPNDVETVAAQVGAFPLESSSHDAALILTVPPSVIGEADRGYTIELRDANGGTGIALAEIYEVPSG